MRYFIVHVLGEIGDPSAVPAIILQLKDKQWHVRSQAALVLGKLKDPRAIQALISALGDEEKEVRDFAVESILKMGRSATPALIRLLEEGSAFLRADAAYLLGKISDPKALPALRKAMKDKIHSVRDAAADARRKILIRRRIRKSARKQ
jgi:HEAT repeat protein